MFKYKRIFYIFLMQLIMDIFIHQSKYFPFLLLLLLLLLLSLLLSLLF